MKLQKPPRVWFEAPHLHWRGWRTFIPYQHGGDEWGRCTAQIGWCVFGLVTIAWNRPSWHVDKEAGAIYVNIPVRTRTYGCRVAEVAPGVNVELGKDALGEHIVGVEILHRHWATEGWR